jgi:glyoxylase-like metal-dependent hydrolase (beta-lactamase superfamily II)
MNLVVETFPVGPLQCNCTILGDPESGKAIVVDPGGDHEKILARLKVLGLKVETLLHTHAHLDHILATRAMKEATGARIHLHKGDLTLYQGLVDQAARLLGMGMPLARPDPPLPVDSFLEDGDAVTTGGLEIEVLHTPGHTEGSCCFGLPHPEQDLLVAGDTLFRGSIGRTDLPGGDSDKIVKSIKNRLYTRDEATRVITGHGPETTIGFERHANAFVRAE